jgi:arylsulfatase
MSRFPLPRLALLACTLFSGQLQGVPAAVRPPNVLLIVAEGMGFSDAGCYGGEIATPCLDWLSGNGVRFSQAYNTAGGADTQLALLSGYYARHLKRESLSGAAPIAGRSRPVWGQFLPELLKPAGYRSYHSGKWLLAGTPREAGFERSYTLPEDTHQFGPLAHLLDGQPLPAPQDGYYSTSAITEHAIQFLKQHAELQPKAPFFACVTFSAPHFPLQAPLEDVARYRTRFHGGTDDLRQDRLQRLWGFGMLSNAELSPPTLPARRWTELSRIEQEAFETRMEIHAAMVERMDREIGRLLEQLQAAKVWENTLVLFLSSHGASAERVTRGGGDPKAPPYLCLEAQGASLANTPLRYSGSYVHEGGISTPLVVHWPGGMKAKGELREQAVHVVDVAPTLLRMAGIVWPKTLGNKPVPDPDGVDLSGVLRENKGLPARGLWWAQDGNRAFRLGDWKWVALKGRPAELYYLRADRAEMLNLAEANHERLQEMEVQWKRKLEHFERDLAVDMPLPALSVNP